MTASAPPPRSGVLELAEKIRADIAARGLRAGDPYLSTAEAAKRFRAGGGTVHRALQLLAGQGRLDRRQRLGTIVAEPAAAAVSAGPQRVQILVQEGYLRTEGLLGDGVLVGLQRRLPRAELAFRFHSADEADAAADEAIRSARGAASSSGEQGAAAFLLVRSSATMQAKFAESGLPTLVLGSLHPTVRGLAQIDRDQGAIGRLGVERFVERGCTRAAFLLRERITAGDHRLLDAAFDALAAAGFSPAAARVRMLPADEAAVAAAVEELLDEAPPGGKLGLLCRSRPIHQGALAALRRRKAAASEAPRSKEKGASKSRRLLAASKWEAEIVLADYYPQPGETPPTAYVEPALPPEAWGERIGDMLDRLCRGACAPDALRECTPVRLLSPD